MLFTTALLKSDFYGDEYLVRHKTVPNIEELRSYLDKQIDFISKSIENFADSSSDDKLKFFYGFN